MVGRIARRASSDHYGVEYVNFLPTKMNMENDLQTVLGVFNYLDYAERGPDLLTRTLKELGLTREELDYKLSNHELTDKQLLQLRTTMRMLADAVSRALESLDKELEHLS